MIDNIQKLYQLLGIESLPIYPPQDELFGTREEMTEFFNEQYLPFTAEEQIALIKWLSNNLIGNFFSYKIKDRIGDTITKYCVGFGSIRVYDEDFAQALAGLFVKLYNNFTDKQKQEIKELLQ